MINVSDLAVLDVAHSKVNDDPLNHFLLFLVAALQLQASSESKCLKHSELREENVILHDVRSVLLE